MEVIQFLRGTREAFDKLLEENKVKNVSFYLVDEDSEENEIKKEEE